MSNLDNAKLKELMKIEPESMSKEEYESFVYDFFTHRFRFNFH